MIFIIYRYHYYQLPSFFPSTLFLLFQSEKSTFSCSSTEIFICCLLNDRFQSLTFLSSHSSFFSRKKYYAKINLCLSKLTQLKIPLQAPYFYHFKWTS